MFFMGRLAVQAGVITPLPTITHVGIVSYWRVKCSLFRLRPPFHMLNFLMSIGRVFVNLAHKRKTSAMAIACGVRDGYRGITGRWELHDAK